MAKSFPTNKSSMGKNFILPTRRGRIKKEIFHGLARSLASATAKAGGVFRRNARDGGSSTSAPSACTPPNGGHASEQQSG